MPKTLSLINITSVFILFILLVFCSCEKEVGVKQSGMVNFEVSSKTSNLLVAYTNDQDSLWSKVDWVNEVKAIMMDLSKDFDTILLFDSKYHTPNVEREGMSYSIDYDKWMVCGYWIYLNGSRNFCYGGMKEDGNFQYCE